MESKRLFFIILRLSFIIFSLKFIRDAFYKWDGYSYHMSFGEFLPELSLAFILWSLNGLIIAVLCYAIIYLLSLMVSRFFRFVWFKGFLEKVLAGVSSMVTPLVFIFSFLLVLSIPLSIFSRSGDKPQYLPDDRKGVAEGRRQNIILVIMDALSAEDMQLYGYHRPTTPFISEWAKDAYVFDRAYSASNWTTPSTMSIMTGQMPWTHRVWYIAESNPVDFYGKNLPGLLKSYGYKTFAFVQNNFAHPHTLGIDSAFDVKDDVYTFWITRSWLVNKYAEFFTKRYIVAKWVISENPVIRALNIRHLRHPIYGCVIRSEMVYKRFFDTISRNSEQPFFAWIHVYPPHDLYLPPEPYIGIFGDAERFDTLEEQVDSNLFHKNYNPERQGEVDVFRKRYDEFILYSDQVFKDFIHSLNRTVDLSNTVIILTSDHGESFSHGYMGHNYFKFYEPLVHIPLIIKVPGTSNGRRLDTPVGHIDIAPTILDLADIPVPEWMEGRSLVPLLKGKEIKPGPVFSMQMIKNPVVGNTPITRGAFAVISGYYKLIYYLTEKKVFLFNLMTDPDERRDISEERPDIVKHLLGLIEEGLSQANSRIASFSPSD